LAVEQGLDHENNVETDQEDWSTIGRRLRWAIDRRPSKGRQRGVRRFQREIEGRAEAEDRHNLGVTLTSIMKYLHDEVTPSIAFLELAADLLGVRVGWLAFGDDTPFGIASVLVDGPDEHHARVERAFSRGAGVDLPLRGPALLQMPGAPTAVHALVQDLWYRRLVIWRPRWRATNKGQDRARLEVRLAWQIGQAIAAPLKRLKLELSELSDDFMADHILAMTPVLRRAIEREDDEEQWP
jgi:transcriptional regulator with XRE-family HTH domain